MPPFRPALRAKIGFIILLQISWQVVSIVSGSAIAMIPIPLKFGIKIVAWFFSLLVLNVDGFILTLLYRRNIAPTIFWSLFDFGFVFCGLIVGLPLGLFLGFFIGISVGSIDLGQLYGVVDYGYESDMPGHYALTVVNTEKDLISLSVPILILISIVRFLYDRHARSTKKYQIEEAGLGQGPQSFKYRELSTATKGFSSNKLLGSGGFGSVYKGSLVLKGDTEPTEIAVRKIGAISHQGAEEFLAEVKIIGQVQHRNLVRVLGWCCEKDELLLVYNYMPNGSVDQHLHSTTPTGEAVLTWARRFRIMNDVATALAYLHKEWEKRVIHRDVKSSNVMLDNDFNARLGDFGLARLSEHNAAPPTTLVLAGTFGYLAPELFNTLQPTEKTDVYSFGAMVLEVATGKKPLLSAKDRESLNVTFLVDWVCGLNEDNALLDAVDCNLQNDYDRGEMAMFLNIGLLCCHPNPDERPTMREVIHIWEGSSPFPTLPLSKPVPVFAQSIYRLGSDTGVEVAESRTTSSAMDSRDHSALTILSEADGESPPPDHHEGNISYLGEVALNVPGDENLVKVDDEACG